GRAAQGRPGRGSAAGRRAAHGAGVRPAGRQRARVRAASGRRALGRPARPGSTRTGPRETGRRVGGSVEAGSWGGGGRTARGDGQRVGCLPEMQRSGGEPVRIDLPAAADTFELGRALGRLLGAGDLVLLTGPLGAGKTVLAQGIGAGLGVTGPVVSPTFVIARVHRGGRLPLVHVDAYRLGSVAEVDDLDLDAELAQSGTPAQWGRRLVEQRARAHHNL